MSGAHSFADGGKSQSQLSTNSVDIIGKDLASGEGLADVPRFGDLGATEELRKSQVSPRPPGNAEGSLIHLQPVESRGLASSLEQQS